MRIPLIAGNWKMYKTLGEAKDFAEKFKKLYKETDIKTCICAPYHEIAILKEAFKGTNIGVGAQNCHFEDEGAFTGEISIPMLQDLGVEYCIVGHSERRGMFNETDETVNKKIKALLKTDITPILCVGEDLFQREHNYQDKLVSEQVDNAFRDIPAELARKVIIAYEPIWAIGTGKTATPLNAEMMAETIRKEITNKYGEDIADEILILYGGSVKPDNITEIMDGDEVDGALVGGASLEPEKFMQIIDF